MEDALLKYFFISEMRRLRQKDKGTERWASAGDGSTVEEADALQPQNTSAPAFHLHIEHLDGWGQQEVLELLPFIIWVENESERQSCEEQQGTEMWREHSE